MIAREIKLESARAVESAVALRVSYNKFLAKIASDYRKPDGLCTIHPDQALDFYSTSADRVFGEWVR